MPKLLDSLVKEPKKKVVGSCCDVIVAAGQLFGLAAFKDNEMDLLFKAVDVLLDEKAECQSNLCDEDVKEGVQEGAREDDQGLLDDVADVIVMMAKICGPQFAMPFGQLFRKIVKYLGDGRHAETKANAIACIGEVLRELGPQGSVDFVDSSMQLALAGLQGQSWTLKHNSAYCCGVICSFGGKDTQKYYETAVNYLVPIVQTDEKQLSIRAKFARDNAVSAICKIIMAAPQAAPLENLLPIILKGCPISEDYEECQPVYGCLLHLCQSVPQATDKFIPQIFFIMAQAVTDRHVLLPMRQPIHAFCRAVIQQFGDGVKPIVEQIPAKQREMFVALMAQESVQN